MFGGGGGMFSSLSNTFGGIAGSARSAKGYDAALEMFRNMEKKAKENRGYMDPFGVERRKEAGDTYWAAMYDPSVIETTGQYQFVRDEALRAAQRQGSAGGYGVSGGSSGNVAAALADRAAGLASKEYTSIMDRLQNLSGANASYGQQAGQTYMGALESAVTGQAQAKIGKENAYAQMNHMAHYSQGQIGDIMAGGFMASDARLKEDIKRVGKNGQLHVYEWKWNDKAETAFGLKGKDKGYLAQEVRKVLPEAVTSIKGYLAIDYGYLNDIGQGELLCL